jgi:hypothetical protein
VIPSGRPGQSYPVSFPGVPQCSQRGAPLLISNGKKAHLAPPTARDDGAVVVMRCCRSRLSALASHLEVLSGTSFSDLWSMVLRP